MKKMLTAMKNILVFLVCIWPLGYTVAQQKTYDILKYTPPAGWTEENKASSRGYTLINQKDGTWCQIYMYKSMGSAGSIAEDFARDWKELVVQPLKVGNVPDKSGDTEADGWSIRTGVSSFEYNGQQAVTTLTTFTRPGRTFSILINTNHEPYLNTAMEFMDGIDVVLPPEPPKTEVVAAKPKPTTTSGSPSGYTFFQTNFDDGWVAIEREDWVEVTKGNIQVLLHYPREGTIFPADPEPLINNAWNVLVAPRYTNLRDYKISETVMDYQRPYFGSGTVRSAAGKDVYVAIFHKGSSPWIEIIAPDKQAFIKEFGVDINEVKWSSPGDIFAALERLPNYNKFAVAAADLKGAWTSNFTGVMQMYNSLTGNYAGMQMNQSNEEFVFKGNTYSWKLLVANGMVGNMNYANVSSTGTFSLPNAWQVHFSKMQYGAKTYDAYFSCVKGARMLWMKDSELKTASFSTYGKKPE